MKKFILGMILILSSHIILSMEKDAIVHVKKLADREAHHLMPKAAIEEGIKSELKNSSDPIEGIRSALQYIDDLTLADEHLKKAELIEMLKDLAKETFAPTYAHFSQEGLDQALTEKINIWLKCETQKLKHITSSYNNLRSTIAKNECFGRDEIVKLIIAGANPNLEIKLSYEPRIKRLFQLIIILEDVNFVRLLIAYGADVNFLDKNDATPLDYAIQGHYGHWIAQRELEIIKLLVNAGANVNRRNKFNINTAIKNAFRPGDMIGYLQKHLDMEALEPLLEHGAELTQEDIESIRELKKLYPHQFTRIVDIFKQYNYEI